MFLTDDFGECLWPPFAGQHLIRHARFLPVAPKHEPSVVGRSRNLAERAGQRRVGGRGRLFRRFEVKKKPCRLSRGPGAQVGCLGLLGSPPDPVHNVPAAQVPKQTTRQISNI